MSKTGIVKFFNDTKGFGFIIQDDGGEDLFAHRNSLADGQNFKISVIDRESMEVLYTFGQGGRQPGTFYAPHSIATDSQNNIYTTETYEGSRVQKFLYQGVRPVTVVDRAPTWPADEL